MTGSAAGDSYLELEFFPRWRGLNASIEVSLEDQAGRLANLTVPSCY